METIENEPQQADTDRGAVPDEVARSESGLELDSHGDSVSDLALLPETGAVQGGERVVPMSASELEVEGQTGDRANEPTSRVVETSSAPAEPTVDGDAQGNDGELAAVPFSDAESAVAASSESATESASAAGQPEPKASFAPPRGGVPGSGSEPGPRASVVIHREEWILAQDPDAWTVQLMAAHKAEPLLRFVKRHAEGQWAYYYLRSRGQDWYSLLYGVYHSPVEARAAVEVFENELGTPWVRKMKDVQAPLRRVLH